MDNRFPSQGPGMRPPGSISPMGLGMPQAFGAQPQTQMGFSSHHPQPGVQGWSTQQQQQQAGQMNFVPLVPSVSASVSGAPNRMAPPASLQQPSGPPSKDRNYLAQQQKLRAMASVSKKPGAVSADSLIDDLLQKKETFTMKPQVSAAQAAKLAEKHSPVQLQVDKLMQQIPSDIHVPPEMSSEGMAGFGLTSPTGATALPFWLLPESSNLLPAVYRHVWELSKSSAADGRELVDTGKIFAILVTSGLPRDSLGYIWNLANTGIPGVLNRWELNVALALVALAQTGWRDFTSTAVLAMVQQPPVPMLQLENFAVTPPKPAPPQQPAVQHIEPNNVPPAKDLFAVKQDEPPKMLSTISQQVSSSLTAGVVDDDFSDFQAAPPVSAVSMTDFSPVHKSSQQRSMIATRDSPLGFNSFESPPISPVFTPKASGKGSREVGSRLANYSFTAPSSSSGSRKSETDNEDDVFKTEELFPKCVIKDKSPGATTPPPFLKESSIRSEPEENNGDWFASPKADDLKGGSDDDKYSALRDLDFGGLSLDPPSSTASAPTITAVPASAPATDDFGDFLSADDSFSQLSSRDPPAASALATKASPLPDFNFEQPSEQKAQDWSASFDAFPEKQNTIEEDLWKADAVVDESPSTVALPEISVDDEDFGDFMGPTTSNTNTAALPSIMKIKESSAFTPDTQSLASLDLGGFDTLSLGGAGPSTSPDGGGGGLLDLRIDGEAIGWESQPPVIQQDDGMEWKQCLHSCISLLQAAAQIFLAIEDQSVIEEVVTSKQGEDYLANLLEVYCVTQRINAASRKLLPSSRHLLEPLLSEVESVWGTLQPFLEQSSLEVKDRSWTVPHENSSSCSLCLTQVEDSEVGSLALVKSGPNSYHAACANVWLNCVNAQLPAILVP